MQRKILLWLTLLTFAATPGLFAQRGPKVLPDHPRLMIRAENGGDHQVITLEMLRARAADPRFERFQTRLHSSMANYAMRALAYDDSAAADSAIALLLEPNLWSGTTWDGIRVMWEAFVFDWLYNHPNFDPWEKALAIQQLAQDGEKLYERLQTNGHIFHTRMYAWATGVAAAGYALSGHYEDAPKLVRFANSYFNDNLLPARRLLGGSVHNGFGYGRHYIMWLTGHYLSMVYSATGQDLWSKVQSEQDNWAAREAEFIIYGRQPDGLMAKFGDCYRRTSERFSFRVISERNWYYHNPVYQGYLNRLLSEQSNSVFEIGNDYIAYLFFDPDRPAAGVESLPTKTLFGQYGTGIAIWRSGWQADDLWLFFRCGDYFGNHGHYDQGTIDIFLKAPLLAEAGAYAGGYNSDFRKNFYRQSVAHNTLLIQDPANPDDIGGQRVYMNQELGTMKKYLADLGAESGRILVHQPGDDLSYLLADLSAAYPGDRVERLTRELALVDNRYLVVRDRVLLSDPRYLPKVLWHCMVRPEIGNKRFVVERNGGRATLQLLQPADATLEWVEGWVAGAQKFELEIDTTFNDPGVGRVEITGRSGQREQTFLQVIDISSGSGWRESSYRKTRQGTEVSLPGGRKLLLRESGAELR